jgi:hypothetical protein
MPVLAIQYDLFREAGRVYEGLIDSIQAQGDCYHSTESVWFVQTAMTPKQVIAFLKPHLHARDKLTVTPVALDQGWWTFGVPEDELDWLRNALTTRRAG